jgi:deoxyribonuclease V
MTILPLHDWPTTEADAVALQHELANRVDVRTQLGSITSLAGCDIAYSTESDNLVATVVVLDFPSLNVIERAVAHAQAIFPYIPGLLSFREIPSLLSAIQRLRVMPDAFMVDGQGIAHPRRFGLASHLGLWVSRPCVGCAKSWLIGSYDEPGLNAGDSEPLRLSTEIVGSVVRSAANAKPVYVSPGHLIDVAGATELVQRTLSGYRHPIPTRMAHMAANEARAKLTDVIDAGIGNPGE